MCHDDNLNTLDSTSKKRTGTVRYMAPEVLNNVLDVKDFEAYKRSDIYSLSLVYWEIARRCKVYGMYNDFSCEMVISNH